MLNEAWLRLLKRHGGCYKVKKVKGGQTGIHRDGAPFMTLTPGMFDYEARIRAMDRSEEHTSELQSRLHLVCRLLLEKKKKNQQHRLHNSSERRSTSKHL